MGAEMWGIVTNETTLSINQQGSLIRVAISNGTIWHSILLTPVESRLMSNWLKDLAREVEKP